MGFGKVFVIIVNLHFNHLIFYIFDILIDSDAPIKPILILTPLACFEEGKG